MLYCYSDLLVEITKDRQDFLAGGSCFFLLPGIAICGGSLYTEIIVER